MVVIKVNECEEKIHGTTLCHKTCRWTTRNQMVEADINLSPRPGVLNSVHGP